MPYGTNQYPCPNRAGCLRRGGLGIAPSPLTVKAGTTVTWINKDDVPHLIVSTQAKFKPSTVLDTDQRFSVTLTKPGTYDYYCSLHPMMQGKIVVQ